MDQKLHEYHLQLWQLTESLRKDWWDDTEKARIKQLLKDAAAHDPSLSGLNPSDPDFFEDLSLKLSSLVISKPEIPSSNMPSQASLKQWDAQKKEQLDELAKRKSSLPLAFLDKKGYIADFGELPQEDIYLILKKHGLVDSGGNFHLDDSSALTNAQEEIGLQAAYYQSLAKIKDAIIANFEDSHAPVTLFMDETFGKEVPGLVGAAAKRIAQNTNAEFAHLLSKNLGGHPISLSTSGLTQSLFQAASGLKTRAIAGKIISHPEARQIAIDLLGHSSKFKRLGTANQNMVIEGVTQSICHGGNSPEIIPTQFDDFLIRQERDSIVVKKTTVDATKGPGEEYAYYSVCTQPKTIAERVQRAVSKQFNLPEVSRSTDNLTSFIQNFSKDPFFTALHYPYYSLIGLLPGPIKKIYAKQKEFRKTWGEAYALSINPELQRKALEELGKKAIVEIGKQYGIFTQDGKFTPIAILGLIGEKVTTGIGEGLGSIFSKTPFIGTTLGNIFRRWLGKGRNRKDNLGTAIGGIFLDIALAIVRLVPKAGWLLLKRIPAVQNFRVSLDNRYLSWETRFGFLKTMRLAGGVGGSFLRGIFSLNTVAGGLLGGLITGSPVVGVLGGLLGATYQAWLNIANNPSLIRILTRPTNVYYAKLMGTGPIPNNILYRSLKAFSKPGVFMAEHGWARVPLKGFTLGYILWSLGVPWYIAFTIPPAAQWLWEAKGSLAKSLWQAAINKSSFLAKIAGAFSSAAPFLSKIASFFGKGVPGGFLGFQLAIYFGLPLWAVIASAAGGLAVWAILAKAFPKIFAINVFGLVGWGLGEFLVMKFGLSGLFAVLLPYGSLTIFTIIGKLASPTIASWLIITAFPAIAGKAIAATGAIAATFSAIVSALAIAGPILIVVGLATVIVVFVIAPAFIEMQALRKGMVHPELKLIKNITNIEKNAANEIVSLDYEITYTYEPPISSFFQLTIEEIDDIFDKPTTLDWFDRFTATSSNYSPSEINPCKPIVLPGGPQMGDAGFRWRTDNLKNTCPGYEILNPTDSKTISLHLVFKYGSWQKAAKQLGYAKIPDICNRIMIRGTKADGTKIVSSLPPLCVNEEGKIIKTPAAELALKIINALTACGISKVNSTNIDNAEKCLTDASISTLAIDEIKASVANYKGYFQCVGLIDAVEAATGGKFSGYDLGTAYLYWTNLPDYQQIDIGDYNNIAVGDILVWTSGSTGHVAMATNVVFDSTGKLVKVEIAEALGALDEGGIRIRELPATDTGIDSPGLAGWQRRK